MPIKLIEFMLPTLNKPCTSMYCTLCIGTHIKHFTHDIRKDIYAKSISECAFIKMSHIDIHTNRSSSLPFKDNTSVML